MFKSGQKDGFGKLYDKKGQVLFVGMFHEGYYKKEDDKENLIKIQDKESKTYKDYTTPERSQKQSHIIANRL